MCPLEIRDPRPNEKCVILCRSTSLPRTTDDCTITTCECCHQNAWISPESVALVNSRPRQNTKLVCQVCSGLLMDRARARGKDVSAILTPKAIEEAQKDSARYRAAPNN